MLAQKAGQHILGEIYICFGGYRSFKVKYLTTRNLQLLFCQDLSICMKLRGEESTGSLMYFSSDPTTTDGVDIPASIFDHGEISRYIC